MDLHKAWKELQQEKFSNTKFDKDMILQAIHQDSNSAMSQLKKSLFIKMMWVVFFTVAILTGMIVNYDCSELLLILSVPLLYFGFSLIMLYQHYQNLNLDMDFAEKPLELMKKYYKNIEAALKYETISGLIFFPIAAITGTCLGEHSKGVSVVDVFQNVDSLIFILIAIVVMTPIAHFGSKSMNQRAFGALQQQLKENIKRMEDLS